ncbi:L,D-transpeptidase family protein [Albibacterium bauzanense]|uniref:Murein L,D-transpeptidase YcbB/YkuD n=1 Tax=Albibacterium bauzanense TaxID=653929 RepID=A0A4R1M346_9SPHI|nr:L,D-transpeptidase family protein [Albibacterium bauzanense]TCK85877.1 murein L,D-transpeptidase YcbB/YkuD [Albibacterium bauzanense]
MRASISKLLPILTLISLFSLSFCGNSSIKNDKARNDSIEAIKAWNKTIVGNFSPQEIIEFDSLAIDSFLNTYPELAFLDSNLKKFYHNRNFHYAWFDQQGLIEQAGNLVARVSNITDEGLFKSPPYKRELDSLILEARMEKQGNQPHTTLELMLTAQYFNFAQIAWQGADQRVSESLKWYLPRKKISYDQYLDSLLSSNPEQITTIKEPVYRQYELLKVFLAKFRKLDNDMKEWPEIVSDKVAYKVNDSSMIISQIKKRLFLLDDFKGDTSSYLFDQELLTTIKEYQARLGLPVDGVIGNGTLKTLNINPKERIKQILVNMERSRWLPLSLQENYLAVNIPEFKLHVYHADSLLWSTNVVVGKDLHQTVTFSGDLKYVVFSPYWNIPPSIVRNEIVPAMKKNSNYISRNNMEITGYSGGLPNIRQKPGPNNSLGLVKFLFPNSYNIYLHDTPAKSLFNESSRAFSHGCVRVEEPEKLAQFLLQGDSTWNNESIKKAMHSGSEKYVTLKKPVPVFITYFTAFVDRQGKINFRPDIYERDERLAKMLLSEN